MGQRLDTYLERLPQGLASHPEAKMKASIARDALASRPLPIGRDLGAPPELYETLRDPPLPNSWLPVTHVVGTLLTIADLYDLDDDAFLAWRREQYRALFAGPLYRVLFAVVSPEKLVAGAATKWRSLTKDSLILDGVQVSRGAAEIDVSWPPHLLAPIIARSLMEGVRAALEISGADKPAIQIHSLTSRSAHYSLRWG